MIPVKHRQTIAVALGAIAALVAGYFLLARAPARTSDPRLSTPVTPLHAPSEDPAAAGAQPPGESTFEPETVERLRSAVAGALASTGVANADGAVDSTVEYTLSMADGDVDRLLGLAIAHGGKPHDALVSRFRTLADSRPDRLRPRDIQTWNAVQVLRWASTLSAAGRLSGVDLDSISARPITAAELETFADVTPRDPGVEVGMAPMWFPKPGLREAFMAGARGLIVVIPCEAANGDRAIAEILLVEHAPGEWYPLQTRMTTRSTPKLPGRDPRPR